MLYSKHFKTSRQENLEGTGTFMCAEWSSESETSAILEPNLAKSWKW